MPDQNNGHKVIVNNTPLTVVPDIDSNAKLERNIRLQTLTRLHAVAGHIAEAESELALFTLQYDSVFSEVQYAALSELLFADAKTGEKRVANTIKEQDIAISLMVSRDENLRSLSLLIAQTKTKLAKHKNELEAGKAIARMLAPAQ